MMAKMTFAEVERNRKVSFPEASFQEVGSRVSFPEVGSRWWWQAPYPMYRPLRQVPRQSTATGNRPEALVRELQLPLMVLELLLSLPEWDRMGRWEMTQRRVEATQRYVGREAHSHRAAVHRRRLAATAGPQALLPMLVGLEIEARKAVMYKM